MVLDWASVDTRMAKSFLDFALIEGELAAIYEAQACFCRGLG